MLTVLTVLTKYLHNWFRDSILAVSIAKRISILSTLDNAENGK